MSSPYMHVPGSNRRVSGSNDDLEDIIQVITKPQIPHLLPNGQAVVEEYTFSSEEDCLDGEDEGFHSDAALSHISVSSSDSPNGQGNKYAIDERPWLQMDAKERHVYESMFLGVTYPSVGESWLFTEDYQHFLDEQMLKYVEDFPPRRWIWGQELAERALNNLRERARWRELGIRVYNAERLPELLRRGSYPSTPGTQSMPQHPNVDPRANAPVSIASSSPAISQLSTTHHVSSHYAHYTEALPPNRYAHDFAKFDPNGTSHYASVLLSHTTDGRSRRKSKKPSLAPQPPANDDDDTDEDAEAHIRQHSQGFPTRARTPPYPVQAKPPGSQQGNKPFKRQSRRQAEAKVLPWNRSLDFKAARANATWSDEYRDETTTAAMKKVREHNAPIIAELDFGVNAKQRAARDAKKRRDAGEETMPPEGLPRGGRRKKDPNNKNDAGDLYHSGSFEFVTAEDEQRAAELGHVSPKELIKHGVQGKLDIELLKEIRLCWRPGGRNSTHNLQHAPFTATESVITRQRLKDTPVLTWKAAECVIDFCPDLLWHDILLRVCSESGMGNKDMRDRFCQNGCYADKATFTKRISAALGQKQLQKQPNLDASGESAYYKKNSFDFDSYIGFFGKRTTNRHINAGARRRTSSIAMSTSSMEGSIIVVRQMLSNTDSTVSTPGLDDVEMQDAVSVQDLEGLDGLSD